MVELRFMDGIADGYMDVKFKSHKKANIIMNIIFWVAINRFLYIVIKIWINIVLRLGNSIEVSEKWI